MERDVFTELAAELDEDLDDATDDEPVAPWPRPLVSGVGPTSDADDFGEESFP
jgi:hypothetical protein